MVLFFLAIVLSVLLRYTDSDYPFWYLLKPIFGYSVYGLLALQTYLIVTTRCSSDALNNL